MKRQKWDNCNSIINKYIKKVIKRIQITGFQKKKKEKKYQDPGALDKGINGKKVHWWSIVKYPSTWCLLK